MENTISVILPIKSSLTRDFNEYFDKAITSIKNQLVKPDELVIVHTNEEQLTKLLNEYDFGELNVVKYVWTQEPNYGEQVNYGIKNSKGTWFSIFEFDDEYSAIWFKNVKKYMGYYPEVQAFLPVVVDVDDKNQFAGFTNEATFAANFNLDYGIVTNELLARFQNFQSSGMVIKKETFLDYGGFKESMKLTFVYEFLLRMTYNSVKIMTIPRLGYKHSNLRPDSIFWDYKFGNNKLSEPEVKFWVSTAKKEYFFTDDRNIKYVESV